MIRIGKNRDGLWWFMRGLEIGMKEVERIVRGIEIDKICTFVLKVGDWKMMWLDNCVCDSVVEINSIRQWCLIVEIGSSMIGLRRKWWIDWRFVDWTINWFE